MLFWCPPDISAKITNRQRQQPGMLIVRKIGHVSLVGYTKDWYNRPSCRLLILCIPPPVAGVYLAVYSATFRVWEAHQIEFEVHLKWETCQNEITKFENIPVVLCSEDMRMNFYPTIIAKPKIDFREELSLSIC
jgi:hypothetical protein